MRGGSPGLTCSLPGQQRPAEPEPPRPAPSPGEGTPRSASPGRLPERLRRRWERGAAAGRVGPGRAGLDRTGPAASFRSAPRPRRRGGPAPRGRHAAAGAAEVAEGVLGGGLRGFEAGPCPAAQRRERGAAGPGAGRWRRLLAGPCPPPREAAAGAASRRPSVSTCRPPPWPGTPSDGAGRGGPGAGPGRRPPYEYVCDKCTARAGEGGEARGSN